MEDFQRCMTNDCGNLLDNNLERIVYDLSVYFKSIDSIYWRDSHRIYLRTSLNFIFFHVNIITGFDWDHAQNVHVSKKRGCWLETPRRHQCWAPRPLVKMSVLVCLTIEYRIWFLLGTANVRPRNKISLMNISTVKIWRTG